MSAPPKPQSPDDELDRKISEAVRIGLPIVIVLLVILAGIFVNASTAVLVAAAGALIAVIAVFWSSLRTLLGETPLSGADAYVFGAPPRVEEEQKRAVLRALKDIEFERGVGKISEEDYQQLAQKYRAEAKRLLQTIDEKSAAGRERAEALVQKKLRHAGLLDADDVTEKDPEADDEDSDETNARPEEDKPAFVQEPSEESAVAAVGMILATKRPAKKKKKAKKKPAFEVEESATTNACDKCGTANDKDAVFCKKCGTRVGFGAKDAEGDPKPQMFNQGKPEETSDQTDEAGSSSKEADEEEAT
jgi:hypothetical protein